MKKYSILLIVFIATFFNIIANDTIKVEKAKLIKIEKTSNQKVFGKIKHEYILATGLNKSMILNKFGDVLWSIKSGNTSDIWMLENGNILLADGSVKEINPKTNEIVFKYKAKITKGGGIYSCQRLKNGNTVIGENSTGRILEISPKGEIVFKLQLFPVKVGAHVNLRMVRKTSKGTYLTAHGTYKLYREYDAKGNILWEKKITNSLAFSIVKLPNGNYLTGQLDAIVEYDKKGNEVWNFSKKDLSHLKLGKICGINVLSNGNIVIGFYKANMGKKSASILEINRDKKLIWRYVDSINPNSNMMGVQILNKHKEPLSNLR